MCMNFDDCSFSHSIDMIEAAFPSLCLLSWGRVRKSMPTSPAVTLSCGTLNVNSSNPLSEYTECRDVKFVFFSNSNFVCNIRILFELRLGLRYIMVSSVHHYTARKYRQAIKTNAYDLLCRSNPHLC